MKFAAEHRAYYEVMFGLGCDIGSRQVRESEAGARAFGVLAGTIMEGQIKGEIRQGDTRVMAMLVWATVHGIATLRSDSGPGDSVMPALSEMLRHGLGK